MKTTIRLALLCAGLAAMSSCSKNDSKAGTDAGGGTEDAGGKQCASACPKGSKCDPATGQCASCVELDSDFCARLSVTCGPASGLDKCGDQRNVTECCTAGVCNNGVCGPPPAITSNDTCASAYQLNFDNGYVTVIGDTSAMADDSKADPNGNCYSPADGPDAVFSFTVTEKSVFMADVKFEDSAVNKVIYLRSSCDAATGKELDCSEYSKLSLTGTSALDPGTYFLWVDGDAASDKGRFTLSASLWAIPSAPPANDTCAAPETLTFDAQGHAEVKGSTLGAVDTTQGSCMGYGADVVYTFTTTQAQKVVAKVAGAPFGIEPRVYVRTTCDSGSSEVAKGCASAASGTNTATLTLGNLPAGTYFLWVDGTSGSAGPYTLTVDLGAPLPVPANDTCSAPETLNLSSGHAQVTGDTTMANDDSTGSCDSWATAADLVYTFTTAEAKKLTAKLTGASGALSPVVYLRSTCDSSASEVRHGCATAVTGSSDATMTVGNLPAGTYFLFVDGADTTSGAFTLTVDLAAAIPMPTNDTCATPQVLDLSSGHVQITGDTTMAANDTLGSCGGSGPDLIYKFTTADTKKVTATLAGTTGGLDPVLSIRTDCATNTSEPANGCAGALAGSTGASLSFGRLPAGTYYLVVDGYGGSAGTFTLTLDAAAPEPPPVNDQCGGAIALNLASGSASATGNTTFAADDFGAGCAHATGGDVVYSFHLTNASKVTATVTSDSTVTGYSSKYEPVISILSSCPASDFTAEVACGEFDSTVSTSTATVANLAPGTYFVVVDGALASAGGFKLDVTAAAAVTTGPTNESCAFVHPLSLTNNAVSLDGTTLGAAHDNSSAISCADSDGVDVVYSLTTTDVREITATVMPLDKAASYQPAVYIGRSCATWDGNTAMACGKAASSTADAVATVAAAPAGTYFIWVDSGGYSHSSGTFNLTVTANPATAQANDQCTGAIALSKGAAAVTGDLAKAVNDYGSGPSATCSYSGTMKRVGADLIYSYTPSTSGNFTVTVTPDAAATQLDLFVWATAGSCGQTSACLGYEDATGRGAAEALTIAGTAGTTYYIVVENYYTTDGGAFTITVQ